MSALHALRTSIRVGCKRFLTPRGPVVCLFSSKSSPPPDSPSSNLSSNTNINTNANEAKLPPPETMDQALARLQGLLKHEAEGKPSHISTFTVQDHQTTNRQRRPGADVLSSPSMIMMMELASADLVDPVLLPRFTTVGFHVDVKHVGTAKLGQEVEARVVLREIAGRKLSFAVEAWNKAQGTMIGTGMHRRAVIECKDEEKN